ncbi:MAG: UDP-N-acetylmuramate dehydrogenase [Thermodesulfobacteriota bacterium]
MTMNASPFNQDWWNRKFSKVPGLEVRFDESMSRHTTLSIGGPADIYVLPDTEASFEDLLGLADREQAPVTVVGGGSNLLVQDGGIEGIVVSLRRLARLEEHAERDAGILVAGGGLSLARLLRFCAERGYTGLEWASGIPGLMGGAVRMNAGSLGFEMKDSVESLSLVDRSGRTHRIPGSEIPFRYRDWGLEGDRFVLAANLSVGLAEPVDVLNRITLYLEEKRQRQPVSDRSAGSVFRNPPDGSAWKLIDEAGMRGAVEGGVRVSDTHANFFVNDGTGTAEQFSALLDRVKRAVEETAGVRLEPEIHILGRVRSIHV